MPILVGNTKRSSPANTFLSRIMCCMKSAKVMFSGVRTGKCAFFSIARIRSN
ncbi:Uncharacterised protein [Vibrio cholerae]|nr:Uncharacterised protein [Vibrio cholerae]